MTLAHSFLHPTVAWANPDSKHPTSVCSQPATATAVLPRGKLLTHEVIEIK